MINLDGLKAEALAEGRLAQNDIIWLISEVERLDRENEKLSLTSSPDVRFITTEGFNRLAAGIDKLAAIRRANIYLRERHNETAEAAEGWMHKAEVLALEVDCRKNDTQTIHQKMLVAESERDATDAANRTLTDRVTDLKGALYATKLLFSAEHTKVARIVSCLEGWDAWANSGPDKENRDLQACIKEIKAAATCKGHLPVAKCAMCDGRGEIGGWAGDGYQTDPCPECGVKK